MLIVHNVNHKMHSLTNKQTKIQSFEHIYNTQIFGFDDIFIVLIKSSSLGIFSYSTLTSLTPLMPLVIQYRLPTKCGY